MNIKSVNINDLIAAKYNPRLDLKPGDKQYEKLKNSIERFGYIDTIVVNENNNVVVGGHQRLKVLRDLGYDTIEVSMVKLNDYEEKALNVALNKISGDWDAEMLEDLLRDINLNSDIDIGLTGFNEDELETLFNGTLDENSTANKNDKKKMDDFYENYENEVIPLNDKYKHSPFSVLNISTLYTADGEWDKSNKYWKELICDNGQARNNVAAIKGIAGFSKVISILDPTLCEIVSYWYTPYKDGNKCFDSFAGDTVFGFVTSACGNEFTGIELREEQVEYNNDRCKSAGLNAKYICDDGRNVCKHIEKESMDLYFSCPPYYKIEKYSDKENDASNQDTYDDFYKILDTAFTESIKCLKNNRFAVVVCGDIRDKKTGEYYDFPGDIKNTFRRNGCKFYNELILVNKVGNAFLRANQNMKNRKTVKIHQNVLVFYKGDTSKIKDEFPKIEFDMKMCNKLDPCNNGIEQIAEDDEDIELLNCNEMECDNEDDCEDE